MFTLRLLLTTRRRDRCSSHWIAAERATAGRYGSSSRMWPSSWRGRTPGQKRSSCPPGSDDRLDIADNAVSQPNPDCTIDSTWDPTIGQPSATVLEQLASLGRLR